jgi:hypothetical protein
MMLYAFALRSICLFWTSSSGSFFVRQILQVGLCPWRVAGQNYNSPLFAYQIKTLFKCFILGELKTFSKYGACVTSCVISCECMCMILCVCV